MKREELVKLFPPHRNPRAFELAKIFWLILKNEPEEATLVIPEAYGKYSHRLIKETLRKMGYQSKTLKPEQSFKVFRIR